MQQSWFKLFSGGAGGPVLVQGFKGGRSMDHIGSVKSAFWLAFGSFWLVFGSFWLVLGSFWLVVGSCSLNVLKCSSNVGLFLVCFGLLLARCP